MREPPVDLEAVARRLKDDGYRGGVVARRLISVHGMEEGKACTLVSQLFGHRVDPRGGETVSAVLQGVAAFTLGLALLAFYVWSNSGGLLLLDLAETLNRAGFDSGGGAFALMAGGFARIVIALVNHGAREDLRPR